MDLGCTTWLEMSGSGPRTGIDPTTTPNWPAPAEWRAIQRGQTLPLTLPNLQRRKRFTAAVRFYALINTALATWWELAVKARSVPEQITSAFGVSQPRLRPQPQLLRNP